MYWSGRSGCLVSLFSRWKILISALSLEIPKLSKLFLNGILAMYCHTSIHMVFSLQCYSHLQSLPDKNAFSLQSSRCQNLCSCSSISLTLRWHTDEHPPLSIIAAVIHPSIIPCNMGCFCLHVISSAYIKSHNISASMRMFTLLGMWNCGSANAIADDTSSTAEWMWLVSLYCDSGP